MATRDKAKARRNARAIHQNIRRIRTMRGLTQEKLGAILKKDRLVICRWEIGPNAPRLEDLTVLADALKVTLDDLLR